MRIVTLTSDLSTRDFYVGAIKGALYSEYPQVNIVDITHQIPSYNISIAAFSLKNCYRDFPEGTIHVIAVSTESTEEVRHLAVAYDNHIFIGPDNGVFALIFEEEATEMVEISLFPNQHLSKFPAKEIFVKAAGLILKGNELSSLGIPTDRLLEKVDIAPTTEQDLIKGHAIYIDAFGNIITNISKEMFEMIGKDRPFQILFRREQYAISVINQNYNEVPEGEMLALFSHNGYLEIAINKGNASNLFGIKLNDTIRIEFSNK